jgi:hypothetical protein
MDSNGPKNYLFERFPTQIIAFVVIEFSYLRFSCQCRPRPESATFLLASMLSSDETNHNVMTTIDQTTVRLFWCWSILSAILVWLFVTKPTPSVTGGESTGRTVDAVNARRLSVRNVSKTPVRFSKLGLYPTEEDAQRNRNELLAQNNATLRVYTSGAVPLRGTAIDGSTDRGYDAFGEDDFVSLLPNTALVLEWANDVSFSAVRLGVFSSTPDPSACRLKWETGSGPQPAITSASFTPMFLTFSSGDTQNHVFVQSDGSHVASNGIYTASPSAFSRPAKADKAVVDKVPVTAPPVTAPPVTGPPPAWFPPGQCRSDGIWKNAHGHTCEDVNTNSDATESWTDVTGKRADAYCTKFCTSSSTTPVASTGASSSTWLPPGQCRSDGIWKNAHGHTCEDLNTNSDASESWTDVTGKRAGDYCTKFCKRASSSH